MQVLFSARDRHRLAEALRQISEARLFRRVQAILHVAQGHSLTEAARWAGVDRASVHRWVAIYAWRHSVEDLDDQPRAGRPRQAEDLDADWLAEVLQRDPRTLGYQATTWTVPLLQAYWRDEYGCVLSSDTLRRRLHEHGWRWKRPRYVYAERASHVAQKTCCPEKRAIVRRLSQGQCGDVLLFADATRLRLFPPLRAAWAQAGEPALVPVSGRNSQHVLFGAINPCTGHRVILRWPSETGPGARAFFTEIRRRYRQAPRIWLLLDHGPAHTACRTQQLAAELKIELVWLPKQWPELNAMDQLWRELKRLVAANRQAVTIEDLAQQAEDWVRGLSPGQALRKAGILSPRFWLKHLLQNFCGST